MSKIQYRGICQVCGCQQAVITGSGNMSKHGYRVKEGWFQGVCGGEGHAPVEKDITFLRKTQAQIRDISAGLRQRAKNLESGVEVPELFEVIGREWMNEANRMIPWGEASVYQRREKLQSMIYSMNRRAELGEMHIQMLDRIADQYHGKPLAEVDKDESKPEKIVIGEKRGTVKGVIYTSTRIDGARVYWVIQGEKPVRGWTGTSAWRRLTKVD